jgi:hypothetical protein
MSRIGQQVANRSCLRAPLRRAKLWLNSHIPLLWDAPPATGPHPPGVPMIPRPLPFVVLRKAPNIPVYNARCVMLTVDLVGIVHTQG